MGEPLPAKPGATDGGCTAKPGPPKTGESWRGTFTTRPPY